MPHRINGCGVTVAPIPSKNNFSMAMQWVTLFFIPLIPLGFILIKGAGDQSYYIIKKVSYSKAYKFLGLKGFVSTLSYAFVIGFLMLIAFLFCIMILAIIFYR